MALHMRTRKVGSLAPCPGAEGFSRDDWSLRAPKIRRTIAFEAHPSAPSSGDAHPLPPKGAKARTSLLGIAEAHLGPLDGPEARASLLDCAGACTSCLEGGEAQRVEEQSAAEHSMRSPRWCHEAESPDGEMEGVLEGPRRHAAALPGAVAAAQEEESSGNSHLLALPGDLLLGILSRALEVAPSAAALLRLASTCRALQRLAHHPQVLGSLPRAAVSVPLSKSSRATRHLLALCCLANNPHACYHVGMIKFYCERKRDAGVALLMQAAAAQHADALYSLALIARNGSASPWHTRNPRAAFLLASRAAALGNKDALAELLLAGMGTQANEAEEKHLAQAWVEEQLGAAPAEPAIAKASGVDPDVESASRAVPGSSSARAIATPSPLNVAFQGDAALPAAAIPAAPRWPGGLQGPDLGPVPNAASIFFNEGPPHLSQEQAQAGLSSAGAMQGADAAAEKRQWHDASRWGSSGTGAQDSDDERLQDGNHGGRVPNDLEPDIPEHCTKPSTAAHQFLVDWWEAQLRSDPSAEAGGGAQRSQLEHCGAHAPSPSPPPSHDGTQSLEVAGEGSSLCSNELCGRRETRPREFQCCASCHEAKYCSRVCQKKDWLRGHNVACAMYTSLLQEHHESRQQDHELQ